MAVENGSIELAGIVKSYDGVTRVVDGVNLKIPDGAYCCFLGPSGCGKTTILRMIAGHEDPTDGEILIGGENVVGLAAGRAAHRDDVPVLRAVSASDRARQHRLRAARARHVEGRTAQGRRRDDREGPADRTGRSPAGAALRRPAAARRAGARRDHRARRVLLLDEPLSALDEQLRVQMRQELRRMQRELGITFIHVTHTQLEAIALADIVVVMEKGKIKQAGTGARRLCPAAGPLRRRVSRRPERAVAARSSGSTATSAIIASHRDARYRGAARQRADRDGGDHVDFAVRRDDIDLVRPEPRRAAGNAPGVAEPGPRHRVPGQLRQGHARQRSATTNSSPTCRTEFSIAIPSPIGDVVMAGWATDKTRMLLDLKAGQSCNRRERT